MYNAGGIPCRVNHGCSVMRLQWNNGVTVDTLTYDPLLVTCFNGLIEEGHPYSFIALNASKEMLEDEVNHFNSGGCTLKSDPYRE